MATGRVEVGGQKFHVPLLPCVTDFASVPAITTPIPVPGGMVTLPSYSGLGCDNVTYNFSAATTGGGAGAQGIPSTTGLGLALLGGLLALFGGRRLRRIKRIKK